MASPPPLSEDSADPRADPLAKSVYLFLKDRSLEDKVLVHRALLDATANVLPTTGAQERALHDVQACAAAIDCRFPSKKKYVAWRAAEPCPKRYLSDSAIRNAFDGWPKMLAALGAPTVADPTTLRLLAVGSYTAEGLQRTLRAWYDAIGGPAADPREITQARCHRWIAERRRLGDRTDLELPRDEAVWTRHLGGWMQALATADLLAHRGQAGIRTRLGTLGTTDDEFLDDLRCAAEALDCVPTVRQFDGWVVAERSRAAERNEVIDLFQSETYQRRFGSWGQALRLAGVITETELLERIGWSSQTSYTKDEALAWVNQYLAVCNPDQLSGARYTAWRQETIRANAAAGKAQAIPSERYLRGRFGSFEQAVRLTRKSGADNSEES